MSVTLGCRNQGGRQLKKWSMTLTASSVASLRFENLIPQGVGIPAGAVVAMTVDAPVGSPIPLGTGIIQKNGGTNGVDGWVATFGGGNLADGDYTATAVIVAP